MLEVIKRRSQGRGFVVTLKNAQMCPCIPSVVLVSVSAVGVQVLGQRSPCRFSVREGREPEHGDSPHLSTSRVASGALCRPRVCVLHCGCDGEGRALAMPPSPAPGTQSSVVPERNSPELSGIFPH